MDTCCICQEECFHVDESTVPLACGHVFHSKCIVPWLQSRSSSCPLCRHDPQEETSEEERSEEETSEGEERWYEDREDLQEDLRSIQTMHKRMGLRLLRRRANEDKRNLYRQMMETHKENRKESKRVIEEQSRFEKDKVVKKILEQRLILHFRVDDVLREERRSERKVRAFREEVGRRGDAEFVLDGVKMTWQDVCSKVREERERQGRRRGEERGIVSHPLLRGPVRFKDLNFYMSWNEQHLPRGVPL